MNRKTTIVATIAAVSLLFTACLAHKVTTTDPATGAITTVTVVDTNNLAIEASALEAVTSVAVSMAVEKDPSVVTPLKNAQKALDGVLNGSTSATTQDVINMLKVQNNPTLTAEVTSLVSTVSALEQKLLQRYGAEAGGQIAIALARSVNAGMIIGLAGK